MPDDPRPLLSFAAPRNGYRRPQRASTYAGEDHHGHDSEGAPRSAGRRPQRVGGNGRTRRAPNVSIKGSGALLDDEHLYFADMLGHKTRENLEHDPRVAVGIHDPERKLAMQVKGRAELIDHGEVFDQIAEKLRTISEELHLPPMKHVVRISVESVWDMEQGRTPARSSSRFVTQETCP